jgi:RNA polymerase sigma factor (sigma-70 family)
MDGSPLKKGQWVLTQQAFDQLLARLDSDRDRAAQEYERIRRKLLAFFDGRGCESSDEQVDEAMNRVARIIEEGREVVDLNSYYFLGVARNVLREYWRKKEQEVMAFDRQARQQFQAPGEPDYPPAMQQCMERCLQSLPPPQREFITMYYVGEKREKIETKKNLAERLGMTSLQIRKRAFKIRTALKECADQCLHQRSTGGNKFDHFASHI